MINFIKELNIEGWLKAEEGILLYDLAKECTEVIVEIGSWKGKSTVWLAGGSKVGNNVKVYAIDHFKGSSDHIPLFGDNINTYDEFINNIKRAKMDDIIVPIVKKSEDAAKNFDLPIGLIFIDAEHEYEDVKKDFELWFSKLIKGGIIAFHDVGCFAGVTKLVKEVVCIDLFEGADTIATITYARKR